MCDFMFKNRGKHDEQSYLLTCKSLFANMLNPLSTKDVVNLSLKHSGCKHLFFQLGNVFFKADTLMVPTFLAQIYRDSAPHGNKCDSGDSK